MVVRFRVSGPVLWGMVMLATTLSVAACGDALRLEPPNGSSGNATSGVGGSGGGATACESNSDCAAPTGVCDTTKAQCVACLVFSDCGAMPGTVCSQGACVCPDEGASWCGDDECVDLQTSRQHCGQCGHGCFGSCIAGACGDAWEPIAQDGAPQGRGRHVAVWTGTKMIVWGGLSTFGSVLNDGGMYDPTTFEWTPMNTVNAPTPRYDATAVWTGQKMIVWGGLGSTGLPLGDGALFDPTTNQWEPMLPANAPSPRQSHTAVWADNVNRMLVWGGYGEEMPNSFNELNTGSMYDLVSGWMPMAQVPPPAASRKRHSAVWTGSKMLIYGGYGDSKSLMVSNQLFPSMGVPGGRTFDPVANAWDVMAADPPARQEHTAVWTGSVMLLFGGLGTASYLDSGFKYEGGLWSAFSGIAPGARSNHTAVWLADVGKMVVWGGVGQSGKLNSGMMYDPGTNSWDDMPLPTVLEARSGHSAVSTGSKMLVWGGILSNGQRTDSGAIFTP